MTRSRASAKAAGSRFERVTADYLAEHVDGEHFARVCGKIMSEAVECGNTQRPLTRSLDLGEEGLAMKATRDLRCPSCGQTRTVAYNAPVGSICRPCAAAHASRAAANRPRPSETDRVLGKLTKQADGCWTWDASLRSNGYGQVYFRGRMTESHRAVYRLLRGDIPPGMQLDHLCRVRRCVNPDHLEIVTPKVNTLRGHGPSAMNARKTHCVQGHEYTQGNTYIERLASGRTKRHCRACREALS